MTTPLPLNHCSYPSLHTFVTALYCQNDHLIVYKNIIFIRSSCDSVSWASSHILSFIRPPSMGFRPDDGQSNVLKFCLPRYFLTFLLYWLPSLSCWKICQPSFRHSILLTFFSGYRSNHPNSTGFPIFWLKLIHLITDCSPN